MDWESLTPEQKKRKILLWIKKKLAAGEIKEAQTVLLYGKGWSHDKISSELGIPLSKVFEVIDELVHDLVQGSFPLTGS